MNYSCVLGYDNIITAIHLKIFPNIFTPAELNKSGCSIIVLFLGKIGLMWVERENSIIIITIHSLSMDNVSQL